MTLAVQSCVSCGRRLGFGGLVGLILTAGLVGSSLAQDPSGNSAAGFRTIVDKQQRETLRQVSEYVAAHPDADDLDQAFLWILETASANGLEAEVLPVAEQFLKRRDLDQAAIAQAQHVLSLGLARTGRRNEAATAFEAYLRGVRFQSPFKALDVASSLSAIARIEGDLVGSREILERVSSAYPLNQQIGDIIEGRIARQELIGQPVPRFGTNDLEGKPIESGDYAKRVLLVDFWGTNCAPCLAEFPNLKQLYRDYHEQGFDILGVSFDDSPATVEAFRARARLPWRMAMNETAAGPVSGRFKVRTIPALFLIDKQGRVANVDVRGPDLRKVIEKLLKSS
ncbi:MAG: TlpA family protein disulfide reductase [Planctomycetes bacterium]|nr:TlpA family protein disulfide reductase [Planctomycetota bacterium]